MVQTVTKRDGDLRKIAAGIAADQATAVTLGVRAAARDLQARKRRMTIAGGLGVRVARAWRLKNFPATRTSASAAAIVFSKAAKIIDAFDRGAVIRAKRGTYLAIPTDAAPKKGVGGKRISPSNFPEARLGKLRFVARRGKPALLVVDGLVSRGGKRGGFRRATVRKATKTRGSFVSTKGLATVAMFTLLKQTRLKKRLDLAALRRAVGAALPGRIAANWPRRSRKGK